MTMKNCLPLALFCLMMASGCVYNIEEELYPDSDCNLENITYSNTVVPILRNSCYGCHDQQNNTANVTLEGYDNLKKQVDSGRLLGTIKHESGFSPMPQNAPQLQDCSIRKIEAWIDNGAPNN